MIEKKEFLALELEPGAYETTANIRVVVVGVTHAPGGLSAL
jgi:hypothetical protein